MHGLKPLGGGPLGSILLVEIDEPESILIIEDGSIVPNANSYIDTDFLSQYALLYGETLTGTTLQREQAILRGMRFVEAFERRFQGCRVSSAQKLAWPRNGVRDLTCYGSYIPCDVIPDGVKNAVAEAALIELSAKDTLLRRQVTEIATVKRLRQKADVLERETEYFEGNSIPYRERFEKVVEYLRPYFKKSGHRRVWRG